MRAIAFAWRSLVRQPARAVLAMAGVAAAGALLFDMLLLSEGLVVSMRDLLERTGWDVRVTSTDDLPGRAPRIRDASAALDAIATLPEVSAAIAVRGFDASVELAETGRAGGDGRAAGTRRSLSIMFEGVSTASRAPWTLLRGADPVRAATVVVNEALAEAAGVSIGGTLSLRASCAAGTSALPPVALRVVGVAAFPFQSAGEYTAAGTFETVAHACGVRQIDEADLILVLSAGSADRAAEAIGAQRPDLRPVTNEEMLGRLQQTSFTYFRQISAVLTTVTLAFAVLLITVLLTVSVNQRLGEIAALRAIGFSRRRAAADVLVESSLIVGGGGLVSLPLGAAMAVWLDGILTQMPGIPAALHFFVFEPRALAVHGSLLVATAVAAALYPMGIVSRLPIAGTLRDQVAG
jgi:putative ABC transport system permease protein